VSALYAWHYNSQLSMSSISVLEARTLMRTWQSEKCISSLTQSVATDVFLTEGYTHHISVAVSTVTVEHPKFYIREKRICEFRNQYVFHMIPASNIVRFAMPLAHQVPGIRALHTHGRSNLSHLNIHTTWQDTTGQHTTTRRGLRNLLQS